MNKDWTQFAVATRGEKWMLDCFNRQALTVGIFEEQVLSRVVAVALSPLAVVDFTVHSVCFAFRVTYAIGRTLFYREVDFEISFKHLQRVRDAIFPILFGSIFGMIHPYLGVYAVEPTKKHIAAGILTPHDTENIVSCVISPITAMREMEALFREVSPEFMPVRSVKKHLDEVSEWEASFERTQSIEISDLKLTNQLYRKLFETVDQGALPIFIKEVAKRVTLVVYPLVVALDLSIYFVAALSCLVTRCIRLIGGQCPAYMEAAGTLEALAYQVLKVTYFPIAASLGFFFALYQAKAEAIESVVHFGPLTRLSFNWKMMGLNRSLHRIDVGESLVLPVVRSWSDLSNMELTFLPSINSHMYYLLVERTGEATYDVELIERGANHSRAEKLSLNEMESLLYQLFSLRYLSLHQKAPDLPTILSTEKKTLDLGEQSSTISNCLVGNFLAALEVLHARAKSASYEKMREQVRVHARRRYSHYARDYFPMGVLPAGTFAVTA